MRLCLTVEVEGDTPLLSLATEVLLTEDVDPPVQPVQLCPAARPGHGLLPALSQEGVEAGEAEDNLRQESHLAGLSPPAVQRDVAGLVETDLRSDLVMGQQAAPLPHTHRAGVTAGEKAGYLCEVTAIIELREQDKVENI